MQLTYTGDGEEELVLEINDFSQLNDKVHGQMGLLPDHEEKSFAKAVLRQSSSDKLV